MRKDRRGLPAPGQKCKSFMVLLVGLCIIAVSLGPRMHIRRGIDDEDVDDTEDLRRVVTRKTPAKRSKHVVRQEGTPSRKELKKERNDIVLDDVKPEHVERIAREEEKKGADHLYAQKLRKADEVAKKTGNKTNEGIHVMVTSNGSPYMNWQTRIMYYHYNKVANLPGSDMKYFTRVLHRGSNDPLMDDIPTVRVEPLDPTCDVWCDYPVASRPWAIQQWLDSGDVKGDWIFMIETDYIFVKPVSIPASGRALGFPFGYIIPTYPTITEVMARFYPPPGRLEDIPGTGNAPVLARTEDVRKVLPIWVKVTADIEKDEEAKEKLGWVREMYAFSIATALAKMPIDLPPVPQAIMVQPPADGIVGDAAILHYTWASEVKDANDKVIFLWDKRKWNYEKGLPPVSKDPPEEASYAVKLLIKLINEAIMAMPKFTRGELLEDGLDPNDPIHLKPQVYIPEDPVIQTEKKEVKEEAEEQKSEDAEEKDNPQEGDSEKELPKPTLKGDVGEGIHVLLTSNGSPYMNWQSRLMLYTFKKVQGMPGNDMRHFSRVLHRMTGDDMMNEMHTIRVDPLDPKCDDWCDYPVASRPDAIQHWLDSGDVKAEWILMIETDYLFVKPITIPASKRALGFPFSYIVPSDPNIFDIMKKWYPTGKVEDIPGTGNAPLLIRVEDLRKVVPIWVRITAEIELDERAKDVLGWVREMYAWSIAMALAKVSVDLPAVPDAIMVQPPEDKIVGNAAIIHYTWGNVIKDDADNKIWEWDKRSYTDNELPPHIPDPPTEKATELQLLLVKTLNEAIDNLPKTLS
eukprot:TRINITY_DN21580_c0_g1_i1.p1 TRINITY_DN21580_c0_g1~~TRINITY_DN21580_c0_g1_i1.p1  ORF type:complete len:801 (+),score=219.38 TRINITY_DN21580_c0_g1_i1:188-2590(+)